MNDSAPVNAVTSPSIIFACGAIVFVEAPADDTLVPIVIVPAITAKATDETSRPLRCEENIQLPHFLRSMQLASLVTPLNYCALFICHITEHKN
jgi:hypothetical protein